MACDINDICFLIVLGYFAIAAPSLAGRQVINSEMTSQESGAKIDNVEVAQVKKRKGARGINILKSNAGRDLSHW